MCPRLERRAGFRYKIDMNAGPLVLSMGDPAGVGAEITARAMLELGAEIPCAVVGDAARIEGHWLAAGGQPGRLRLIHPDKLGTEVLPPFGVLDIGAASAACVAERAPTVEGGAWQLKALSIAADIVGNGQGRALVTGPTSKEAITLAGTPFSGQTEFLAQRAGLRRDDVTMLFLGPRLRVGLVGTHFALRDVPDSISAVRVVRTVRHLAEALHALEKSPRVQKVCVVGLNPHAGEGGLLGREEIEVLSPALDRLRTEALSGEAKVDLVGPSPAEAAFRWAADGKVDGVVAMFHDQATIASKLLDWGQATNVTWGLPFVRTSVDHGVAYDAAASGDVSAEGMITAVQMAQRLTAGPGMVHTVESLLG